MLEIFQVITLISYCRSKLLSNLCPFLVFGWKNGAVVSTAASQPFSVEFACLCSLWVLLLPSTMQRIAC